jgi:sensor histidine kinase YesM
MFQPRYAVTINDKFHCFNIGAAKLKTLPGRVSSQILVISSLAFCKGINVRLLRKKITIMKLTFKTFAIELAVNLLIFSGLCVLFILIFFNNQSRQMLPQLAESVPILIIWLSFTILLFHKVFLKLFPKAHYKKAIVNFLCLLLTVYVADIASLNFIIYSRGERNPIFFYSPDFWMRFTMFFAYAVAYAFIRGFSYLREQRAILQKENIESQLKQLQSQIEPHLIFNTLNSIYALALEEKAERTSLCIEELSALFLYSFRNNEINIPVSRELDFLEKYIHLHEIRFGDNKALTMNTQIEWDNQTASIAPMLLINFIENAFKYGVDKNGNSIVNIYIGVKSQKLNMLIENTIHAGKRVVQNGVGLENTKRRLELIYTGNYNLKEIAGQDRHQVQLEINLAQ